MAQQSDSSWGSANPQALNMDLPRDEFVDFLNLDNLDATFAYPFEDHTGSAQDLGQFDFSGGTVGNAHGVHSSNFPQDSYNGYVSNGVYAQNSVDCPPHVNRNIQAPPVHGAPPTPNSAPLYAKPTEYYQQASNNTGRFRPRIPNDGGRIATAFSPFISPEIDACASAVSHTPDYAISGVYSLSPLTSPAMQPETPHLARQDLPSNTQSSSPNIHEWDQGDEASDGEEESRPRKTRRKAPTRAQNSSTAVKSRKTVTSTSKRKGSVSKHLNPAQPEKRRSSLHRDEVLRNKAPSGSTSNSISPRPLDEVLMGPPPKPGSTSLSNTPHIAPEKGSARTSGPPATPASMMGFRSQASNSSPNVDRASLDDSDSLGHEVRTTIGGLDFLELPESATPMGEASSGTNGQSASNASKSASGTRGYRLGDRTSPHIGSNPSPSGPTGAHKPEPKASQISKKRSSAGSTLVSPALRPKVSPNVKPLLPDGSGMDSETHALLLASRSNYENILSGAHLPGVSYPADLGANLSSKRTSHKLAEQGRRNRINFALQEMQALLPAKFTATLPASKDLDKTDSNCNDGSNAGRAGHTPAQNGNSKAATVECAIEYIRHLQRQCQLKDDMVESLKNEASRVREGSP